MGEPADLSPSKAIPILPPMSPDVSVGRVPPWGLDRLVHRACPICGADRPEDVCLRPDGLLVSRCLECHLIYLADVPDDQDLDAFYRDYDAFKDLSSAQGSWLYRLSPLKPVEPYLEILRRSGGVQGRRLCEIGCAKGAFLLRAQRAGASVIGIELDATSVRTLTGLGITVEPELQGEDRFDVVCAFHVLEHLSRPSEFIERAARALKPDGRLLLAMPNGGEAERTGPAWVGYRVDLEHLNYFSVATLARLMNAHGLQLEQYWECQQPNLPRTHSDAERLGLGRRVQEWLGGIWSPAWYQEGSFNLVVLARKSSAPRP